MPLFPVWHTSPHNSLHHRAAIHCSKWRWQKKMRISFLSAFSAGWFSPCASCIHAPPLCQPIGVVEMNEGASSIDAELPSVWTRVWNSFSWDLCPSALLSVGCRLRNGGQGGWGEVALSLPFGLLTRFPTLQGVKSQSSHIQCERTRLWGLYTVSSCWVWLADWAVFSHPLKCFMSVTPDSHLTVQLLLKDNSLEV